MNAKHKFDINIDWRIMMLLCTAIILLGITFYSVSAKHEIDNRTLDAPLKAGIFTGYYNILGHEGIPINGDNGTPPPVGDYESTHCRYIDVANTYMEEYFLIYTLNLPNGVTITEVALHIADYSTNTFLKATLFKREWDTRASGTQIAYAISSIGSTGDTTINMPTGGELVEVVDNLNYEYWISITPTNSEYPGQLCVYGIQVTYTYDGSLLPLVVRNN